VTCSGESGAFLEACHWDATRGCVVARLFEAHTRSFEQKGQAQRSRVRSRTVARHAWVASRQQRHQAMRLELATTALGASAPLFSGSHSEAISGNRVARLFVTEARRFAQNGQPAPRVLLFGFARQRWSGPRPQTHQTRRPEPAETSVGRRSPFPDSSHS
jgi:hypothetical protein